MKKFLLILLIAPFFFACEKDDESVNVTIQDPNAGKTQEVFRLDEVEVTSGGFLWTNETYVYLRIANETNEFNWFNSIFIANGLPAKETLFVPSTPSKSDWRIFVYPNEINVSPGFMQTIDPTEFKDSDTTFVIPITNGNGSSLINLTLSGAVLNVPVD